MVTGTFFLQSWVEPKLVFGAFIDVPLIVGGFALMYRFRERVSRQILKLRLPGLALYLMLSVPLIIFEEQIDCMPAWCGAVLIPPTFPFLFVEILVLGGLVMWRNARNVKRVTLGYSIFGVLFEIFLGGLVGAPLLIIAIIGPYVMIGYGFISLLPLSVLVEARYTARNDKATPGTQIAKTEVNGSRSRPKGPTVKTKTSCGWSENYAFLSA